MHVPAHAEIDGSDSFGYSSFRGIDNGGSLVNVIEGGGVAINESFGRRNDDFNEQSASPSSSKKKGAPL